MFHSLAFNIHINEGNDRLKRWECLLFVFLVTFTTVGPHFKPTVVPWSTRGGGQLAREA